MNLIYFIGFLLNLFFGIYFSFFSHHCFKKERIRKVFFMFLLIGISFLIISFFYFMWSFDLAIYSDIDFSLINSILIFFRVVVLLVILSYVFNNNNFFAFLFFYLSVLVAILYSFSLSSVVYVMSFLIMLLISLILYSKSDFKRVGMLGIFYSFSSVLLFSILFLGVGKIFYVTILLNILFFLFLFEFVSSIKQNTRLILRKGYFKSENSVLFDFLRYFVFIVVLTNFVFVGSVSIHELGHFAPSYFLDCSYTKIVYEEGLPHTETLCQEDSFQNYLISMLGGLVLPLLVALFFFFSGGQFIHEIGMLIIGFNLIISYRDFLDLGFSETFSLFVTIIGLLTVVIAIGLLVSSRSQEIQFLEFTEGHKTFYKKGGK